MSTRPVSSPSSTNTTKSPRSNTSCPFKSVGSMSSLIILFKSTAMPALLVILISPSKTAFSSKTGSPFIIGLTASITSSISSSILIEMAIR